MKKPKDKTLGQIQGDIKKGEMSAAEIEKTYEEAVKPKTPYSTYLVLTICVVIMAFGILERSRFLSIVAGVCFVVVVFGMIYDKKKGI